MKKINIAILAAALILSVALFYLLKKSPSMGTAVQSFTTQENLPLDKSQKEATNNTYVAQNEEVVNDNSPPSQDQQSLQTMVSTLASFATSGRSLEELMDYLKKSKQDPVMIEDKNEHTGTMYVVRTNSPFPGTRYFHAQYFADEDGKKFSQHMSFEFKPGPQAFQEAIQSVQKSFQVGAPIEQTSSFAKWELKDGYIVWIKKQSAADLDNNAMHPSTDADIGSVRIAVEQSPHDDLDDEHSH